MKIKHVLLSALSVASLTGSAFGQIQSAGSVLVNVDATSLSPGAVADIVNSGTLGGYFEARGAGTTVPLGTNIAGVNTIWFDGSNDYLQLVDAVGGNLVAPPTGIVGPGATASIEVWAYNPTVGGEETMISWGRRGAVEGNMAFSYGYSAQIGAVSHQGTGVSDMGWEMIGGAPQNHRWHHLVYTYDGATTRVYSDGVLVNSEAHSINTTTNAGVMLGAQWNAAGTAVGGQYGSLAVAKVRVHDGVLTPAQVANNFDVEKGVFLPAAVTAQLLASGPAHRYSFNEPAASDATGVTFNDSIGTAHGVIQGLTGWPAASLTGSRLQLPGGPAASGAYADLPNGLLSANSTSKGGTGEFTMEVWYKVSGVRSWAHLFDFGSVGIMGNSGMEIPGPGGQTGLTMLDDFMYGASVGTDVNRRRLEWANRDIEPSGSTTNGTQNIEITQLGSFNNDRHVVVTWKESTGQIFAYENGVQVATLTVSNSMSAINDVNNWLGRSQYGDNTMEGEIDEVRIYGRVLSAGEALGNYQAGPNVLNTTAALAIATQPQNQSVIQGSPATFSVSAGGTPPLFYQWLKNSAPVAGATNRTYTIDVTAAENNGEVYSVIVSNLTTSTTSGNATLTVTANAGVAAQFLYEYRDGNRDNFSGLVGGIFQVGASDAPVTHLGYYDMYSDGLNGEHRVGIWPASGGDTPIAFVTVPPGTEAFGTNGYRWVALTTPLLLKANTSYVIAAEVTASSGDGWPDNYQPANWNPTFVGNTSFDTRQSRYGSGTWPNAPMSGNQVNGIYGAAKLATIPMGQALAGIQQTTVTQYATMNVTIGAAIGGQAPVRVQWYKSPGTLLAGKTNSSLVLSNITAGDAGAYFVRAQNALGQSDSAEVTLVVLNDTPATITLNPTNQTVLEGFPVTFAVNAAGTPPITYQWRLNGNVIPGATNNTYTVDPVTFANNGQVYSVVASNFANGASQLATSGNATLTVRANKAPAPQILHSTWTGNRDNYDGVIGGIFQVGGNDSLVTHLGFFDLNGDGLNRDHNVGIWPAEGGNTPLASVLVPAGSSGFLTNGYRYIALEKPIVLAANTSYILAAESFSGSGDGWPDSSATIAWDDYYVGANPASTRDVRYSGFLWPTAPAYGSGYGWGANTMYGAPNMAVLPVGAPVAWVSPTNVNQYVGLGTSLTALVNGEAPLVVQWYKSPGTVLAGQTNLALTFSSLTMADSGDYYVMVSNPVSGASGQSVPVKITVQALSGPAITENPQSTNVYAYSSVTFTGTATGTPPLSYQWTFNGTPIPGATDPSITIDPVSSEWAGSYRLVVTNQYGDATSSAANLSVIPVAWGSYASSMMQPDLLVYYRLNDAASGFGVATNQGSAGFAYNGTYEGGYTSIAGPTGSHFEPGNTAVSLDGLTSDVVAPSPNVILSGATMAAWINKTTDQVPDAGIVMHRATDVFGLSTYPDTTTGSDMLRYTWKGTHYSFATGLVFPTNEWALVAASISSDAAVLYIRDSAGLHSATNVAAHGDCSFAGNTYIGWDSAGGDLGRRWAGAIDEVMVFGRPLSDVEINALYLGVPGNATLDVQQTGNNLTLTWPGGTLMEANEASGPWTPLPTATSPHTVTISGKKFYRVQLQ